ncbi:MAG: DUF2892 domain-containing protein [Bacillota bacterium]|nr:DUF2892 domain-containing protein [Bacillota bacterium]
MKKNVGDLDRYLRIAGGLYLLGYGINRDSGFWTAMGALKVAEGVTRFCPMLNLLGLSTAEETPKVATRVRKAVHRITDDI